jgi:DNA damage-binding protein 1
MAFLPTLEGTDLCIAMLYIDHLERLQLIAYDVRDSQIEDNPSALFQQTILSAADFPFRPENVPRLVTVHRHGKFASGGVLILGGKRILYYSLSSDERLMRSGARQRKVASQKKKDADVQKAKNKENERKRKPDAAVKWPWSEVAACVVF